MQQIHQITCGNVNCFLLTNGDRAVLVDTARTAHRRQLSEACCPYRVGLILLTHGHIDHVQNAAWLSRTLGAPIAMSREDLNLIPDNRAQALSARGLAGRVVLGASLREFRRGSIPAFTPEVLLQEGDRLDGYGVDGEIIALPGHTAGSLGIVVPGQGVIVGDALMNMFRPGLTLLYQNEAAMRQSAEKIGELGEMRVYFGHGNAVENRRWV